VAFTMQCNSVKFQPGQIEFLTENRDGIKATSDSTVAPSQLGTQNLDNHLT